MAGEAVLRVDSPVRRRPGPPAPPARAESMRENRASPETRDPGPAVAKEGV